MNNTKLQKGLESVTSRVPLALRFHDKGAKAGNSFLVQWLPHLLVHQNHLESR